MNQVFDSRFRTLDIAQQPAATPTTLCEGMSIYTNVLVRNLNGAGEIWLSYDETEITGGKVGLEKFIIPAGERDVVTLAPNQKLFAVSVGGNGRLSMMRAIAITAYPQVM